MIKSRIINNYIEFTENTISSKTNKNRLQKLYLKRDPICSI